jgi:hypothetical protein
MDLASHCLLLRLDLSVSGYDVVNNSVLTLRAMGSKMVKANLPSLFLMTHRVMPTRTGGTGMHAIAFGYTKPITIVVNIILADRAITFRGEYWNC